jgi:universal stress protein A
MIALTRILVPTNLGEPSKAAVNYGVELARRFNARLFLLRVLPADDFEAEVEAERVVETLEPALGESVLPTPGNVLRNVARAELEDLLAGHDVRETDVEFLLRPAGSGGPSAEIAAYAREIGAELIVIGKHRVGVVAHLISGSVTEKLVRQAPCPVLIVHHPEHEFVMPDAPGNDGE